MDKHQKRLAAVAILLLALPVEIYAATQIDLNHQNLSVLQSFVPATHGVTKTGINLQEVSRDIDFKQTLHVRVKQTYQGFPVWGGDAIIHIPHDGHVGHSIQDVISAAVSKNGSLDGTLYHGINTDLINTPTYIFQKEQADKALKHAINIDEKLDKRSEIKDQNSELIVYIDDHQKAHWAFKTTFFAEPAKSGEMPTNPIYILDAVSFQVYVHWDNIQTVRSVELGGGYGGNKKLGQLVYDGLEKNLAKLNITKKDDVCTLENADVTVKHYRTGKLAQFTCKEVDPKHDNVYWDGSLDAVNGGYSPDNDALFGGAVIKDMYAKWYKVDVLKQNGKPMMLVMVVHDPIDNAFWDGRKMTFGDGVRMFYPLTSIGVAAHEVSHGFTQQHSNLTYYGQSGGINEAFSDMAAQAAEQFAFGENTWQIGSEIFKKENESLRYMDKPSKDCKGKRPGDWCSIDTADQYYQGLDVHFSSGVYNHFFYLLGTTEGWDAKKAFEVMVQANKSYWSASSNFANAACGVIKATKDLGYDVDAVTAAFKGIKVDTSKC